MHHVFPPSGVYISGSGGGESQRITAAVQAMTLNIRLATTLIQIKCEALVRARRKLWAAELKLAQKVCRRANPPTAIN